MPQDNPGLGGSSELQLAAAPFSNPWSQVIAGWRMIEIRHVDSDLVDELADPRHLLVDDLVRAVGVDVVVAVQAGGEENYGYPVGGVAVVIAACIYLLRIRRVVHLVIQLQGMVQLVICADRKVMELGADSVR